MWITVEADEIAGARIEARVARGAIGVPIRRPGLRAIGDRPVVVRRRWRRRQDIDLAGGERAADNGADTEAKKPRAPGIAMSGLGWRWHAKRSRADECGGRNRFQDAIDHRSVPLERSKHTAAEMNRLLRLSACM